MTGMTPDDLAAIRKRVEGDRHVIVLTDAETALCESDREDLLAEVDRFRAGIELIEPVLSLLQAESSDALAQTLTAEKYGPAEWWILLDVA